MFKYCLSPGSVKREEAANKTHGVFIFLFKNIYEESIMCSVPFQCLGYVSEQKKNLCSFGVYMTDIHILYASCGIIYSL